MSVVAVLAAFTTGAKVHGVATDDPGWRNHSTPPKVALCGKVVAPQRKQFRHIPEAQRCRTCQTAAVRVLVEIERAAADKYR